MPSSGAQTHPKDNGTKALRGLSGGEQGKKKEGPQLRCSVSTGVLSGDGEKGEL